MLEKLQTIGKKVYNNIIEVIKKIKGRGWSFAKIEGRIYQSIVAVVFFVCLCCGVGPILAEDSLLAGQVQDENVKEELQATIETRPRIPAMLMIGFAEDYNADVALKNPVDGSEPFPLEYIKSVKEFIAAESIGTRYVSGTCVNLRKAPNLESDVLNKLYRNTEVELLVEDKNGFSVIRYNGQVGYMYSEYLSETKVTVETKPQYDYNQVSNLRERIAAIAKNNQGTQPCIGGYCAKWVSGVYQAAGMGYPGGNAIDFWTRWGAKGSTRMDNIPVGAVVVGSGSGSELGNKYGHVGIYIGNGLVADNVGYHRIISIWEWASYNKGTCNGYQGYIGWVWPYGTEVPE